MDNLPKVNKCPLNWGHYVLFAVGMVCWTVTCGLLLGPRKLSVIRSSRVSERQSGVLVISWVSAVEGCPLSRVPLYSDMRKSVDC